MTDLDPCLIAPQVPIRAKKEIVERCGRESPWTFDGSYLIGRSRSLSDPVDQSSLPSCSQRGLIVGASYRVLTSGHLACIDGFIDAK